MKTEQFRINENSDFPGVYIIVNMDNQKVYIGSTRNICKRLKAHLYSLKKGKHSHKAESYELGNIKRANSQFNDFFEVKEKYKAKVKLYCKEYYEEELAFFLKQAMR